METALSTREQVRRDIAAGLNAACKDLGWNVTRLAAEADATEAAAAQWLDGRATPGGVFLVVLMRKSMVVRDRLLALAS